MTASGEDRSHRKRTDSAPLNSKDIKTLVSEKLKELGIQRAVIVDDAFDRSAEPLVWTELIALIRETTPDLFSRIEEIVAATTGDLDQIPDQSSLEKIKGLIAGQGNAAAKDKVAALELDPALRDLEKHLRGLGLDVLRFTKVDDRVPTRERLYFIDYRLRPEQPGTEGVDASSLLKNMILGVAETGDVPAALLMSRTRDNHSSAADWESVAWEGGGFIHSNFRYLDKSNLSSENRFLFFLYDLLDSVALGRDYFDHVRRLREAAKSIVDRVASETCGLLPADFRVFADVLAGGDAEQRSLLANHLLGVFTGLLTSAMRNDTRTQGIIGGFFDMLTARPSMAPGSIEAHSLHRLHSKLLYDRSKWALDAPTAFGDIYRREDESAFYLVITPECDLEPRVMPDGQKKPKVPHIVLVRGELRDVRPPKGEVGNQIATPLFPDEKAGAATWIYWDLWAPSVVPWQHLAPTSRLYHKWGQLRSQEAEKIQMRYATDLLSVGTDDLADRVVKRKAALWRIPSRDRTEDVELQEFYVMEIVNPKEPTEVYWALGSDCEHCLCSDTDPMVPAQVMTELRRYTPKKEFVARLERHNIWVKPARTTIKQKQEIATETSKDTESSAAEEGNRPQLDLTQTKEAVKDPPQMCFLWSPSGSFVKNWEPPPLGL